MSELNNNINYQEFLPYIDVAEGLSRLMGNKKLYAKLLNNYLQTVDIDSIRIALDSNTETARNIIHSYKGIAANLSVNQDFHCFKQLELLVRENHPYIDAFNELVKSAETGKHFIEKLIILFENC